jgi:hypothetical protein
MNGFVGYDADGRFVHYCHCGAWGAFGVGVALHKGKLGTWRCREHSFVACSDKGAGRPPVGRPEQKD